MPEPLVITMKLDQNPHTLQVCAEIIHEDVSEKYKIRYRFVWGDGTFTDTDQPMSTHTYRKPGVYSIEGRASGESKDPYENDVELFVTKLF